MRRQATLVLTVMWLMLNVVPNAGVRLWAASSRGLLLVSNVTLEKQDSGDTFVNVNTSRAATYRVSKLPSPARLVVDIDDAETAPPQRTYEANTAVLKAIRIGQFRAPDPATVRIVADLNGNPAYNVLKTTTGIRIELRSRETENSTQPSTKPPIQPQNPNGKKNMEVASNAPAPQSANNLAEPATAAMNNEPSKAPPMSAVTGDSVKSDVQSTLPAITRPKQAAAAPLPLPASETPEALRAERAAQTLKVVKEVSPSAAQGNVPPANPSVPSEEAKPVYTGEPISLNLKDVDLKDFFRLIHEISGLNIVIDPNVTGSLTLVLDSVPWDQALDIVLKDNGLGKVLEGNVLRIARIQTLTAEQDEQTKLTAARLDAAPLVTVFRHLNYAKATDIVTLLKTWTGGGALSRRGTVMVDARGNTVIISDVQSQIPNLMDILDKVDKKVKQVSIEARVVLATADFTRILSTALYGTGNPGASTQAGTVTDSTQGIIPGSTLPVVPTAVTGFGTFAITNASSRYLINAIISAQEERDQAKTISRPSIVTQNNVQGMVQQGVQIPIQTTINNTISVQYVAATLRLQVTPQVTDQNDIFLVIDVTNASVGATVANLNPSINTQQATTSVVIPDGGTVVFGGITVTTRSKSATYIPLLGNIPVLGHLFKTSNANDQDQELLFFVSPKIIGT